MNAASVIPVILCGGSGTRLWPYSRERHPKQFLNLTGPHSMARQTMDRAKRITGAGEERIVVIARADFRAEVAGQMGEAVHVVYEPVPRNTAAAIACAALYVAATFGENALMWVLPADHHIGREDALVAALDDGKAAAEQGSLVAFGIAPTRPETGYGYIAKGEPLIGETVFRAAAFHEKPDRETAESYIATGNFLWNSGMFLCSAQTVLTALEAHAPSLLQSVRAAVDAGTGASPDHELYKEVPAQMFDRAVMEKADNIALVPCAPEWSDIGCWQSLWEARDRDESGNAVSGNVVLHETKNCLMMGKDKKRMVCVGIEDLVIVDTDDILLVASRRNEDRIRELVEKLKADGQKT